MATRRPTTAKKAAAKKRPTAAKPAAKKKPAKKPTAAKKPPITAPDEDRFAPASFQTLENGMFDIWFDIGLGDDFVDLFEAADLEGSGYDWEAVLAPALERRDPRAAAAIEYSPEGDTFVAISKTTGPLEALAALLRELLENDGAKLAKAIRAHDPDRT